MNFKRLLMGFASAGLMAAILIPIAPRAARAVVATLVQVANTASNPAMTQDITRQAAQLVEVSCSWNSSVGSICAGITPAGVEVEPYQVPSTQFLVVTSVVGNTFGCGGLGGVYLNIGPSFREFLPVSSGVSAFTYPSGFVIAPGSQLSILPLNINPSCNFSLSMYGYLTTN